jgi:DNA-directed RNA polymerase delta subunit
MLKASDISGGLGLLNSETGQYCAMNSVGSCIWNLTEKAISVNELIRRLTEIFDVSYADCKNSVIPFLKDLKKNRLIEIVRR